VILVAVTIGVAPLFGRWLGSLALVPGVRYEGGLPALLGGAAVFGVFWGWTVWRTHDLRSVTVAQCSHQHLRLHATGAGELGRVRIMQRHGLFLSYGSPKECPMKPITGVISVSLLLAGCASGGPDLRVRGQLVQGAGFTECDTGKPYEIVFPDTLGSRFGFELRELPKNDRVRVELRGKLSKTSSGRPLILVMGYRDLMHGGCPAPVEPERKRGR
jgi:hypothetical protein